MRLTRSTLLLAAPLLAGATTPDPHVGHLALDAATPYVVAAINGVQLKLRVHLDAHEYVVLNPAAARRAGLEPDGGSTMNVGPVKIDGDFVRGSLSVDGRAVPAPINWYAREVASDADGVVSPALLPFDSVTLSYRAPVPPTRLLRFVAVFDDDAGIHVPLRVGKRRIEVRFAPDRDSFATTAAAAVLAQAQGSSWDGSSRRLEIGFGVERPVRPLVLARPVAIGELSLDRLLARLADFAGNHELPDEADLTTRPGEILVRARRARQYAVYRITLGRPTLAACHAATYRPVTRELTLACGAGD